MWLPGTAGMVGSAGWFPCILRSVGWLVGLGWAVSLYSPLGRLASLDGFPALSRLGRARFG